MRITKKAVTVGVSCAVLAIGNCGAPLLLRLYFLHGGSRVWFSSFLQTAGFPFLLPLLFLKNNLVPIKPPLFTASACIGLLTGLDDYLYSSGVARLPVSTSSLIIATQLAFTALFAYLLVGQKFTPYSVNSVVVLTMGAAVLGLHGGGDKGAGEYYVGFVMTLGAAILYGFILPGVEWMYKRVDQEITPALLLQIQIVISFFATLVCAVGMLVNRDFQAIPREAREFGLGEAKYYVLLVWTAVVSQCFFMGAIAVIFCSTSLFSGVVISALLPITEILAVIFFKEEFQSEKGLALALSLWGFVSYFYGEIKQVKQKNIQPPQTQLV